MWTTDERKRERERSVCKLSGYLQQRCSSGPIVPQRHKSPLSGKLSAKRSPTTGELTHCACCSHVHGHGEQRHQETPAWPTFHRGPTTGQREGKKDGDRGRGRGSHDRGTRETVSRFSSVLDRCDSTRETKGITHRRAAVRRAAETVYGDRGRAEAESLVERP